MKGCTIHNSIDRLEKRGGGSGSGQASEISFDNTGTSLTATNVQTAIAEVDTNVSANVANIEQLQLDVVALEGQVGIQYPTTSDPIQIGKIGNDTLYMKRFTTSETHVAFAVIGTVPDNSVIDTIDGVINGTYESQRIIGKLGISFGNGWGHSVQVIGNNVQVSNEANVTSMTVYITYHIVEPEPEQET